MNQAQQWDLELPEQTDLFQIGEMLINDHKLKVEQDYSACTTTFIFPDDSRIELSADGYSVI